MDKWGKLVEERLQAAFAAGEFADLPGKGRPLALDEDTLADPDYRLARHILRNSGMSLPWVEERRRIEKALSQAKSDLERARSAYRDNRGGSQPDSGKVRWRQAVTTFHKQVSALNRRIRTYNLAVPHVRFQRCLVDGKREVERLHRQGAREEPTA